MMSNIKWQSIKLPSTEQRVSGVSSQEPRGAWTLEETKLLLKVVLEYKASQAANRLDWENLKNKYDRVTELFWSNYPKDDSEFCKESFPNSKDLSYFTKEKIVAKVKRVRANYRKAINTGRRSNGGRTVFALFEDCTKIWGGGLSGVTNTTTPIKMGIETRSSATDASPGLSTSDLGLRSSHHIQTSDLYPNVEHDTESIGFSDGGSDESGLNNGLIQSLLSDYNTVNNVDDIHQSPGSMSRKRNANSAELITLEEIELKKQALEMHKDSEKQFLETMKLFSDNLNTLTNVIDTGFQMLQSVLQSNISNGSSSSPNQ